MKIQDMMEQFAKLNISREAVLAFDKEDLKRMSNRRISNNIYKFEIEGKKLEAKFSFNKDGKLMVHPKRKEISNTLKLSQKQLEQLKNGETVMKNGNLVKLDPTINELLHIEAKKIIVPKKIQGISISQEQKDQLLKGKEITLKGKHDIPIKVKYDVAKADFSIKTQNPELKQDLKIADTNKDMSIEKEVSRQKSKGPKR
ncbi:MAG: DUF3945 domain-containing protein [Flavobacteriales bacterium]|jgi:hypothetical protein